ncbi:mitochondrial import inner membrane translocase subunit Tim13 isoform X1 [Elephas maximus indicus]|uniref:mitochondrial import inner membrane translocase subunit Tim13 isoform X1 n=1 Tax=Elephas maximus indicus TaxID=99487 RepID=UPI002116282C|nr:mitochondrial import inner membrane translocase subunit Tim13 isoform X1 [Elephas maximus indicus]
MEGSFGSDFGSSGGGKLDPGLIMEQVKVQIAVANAQELLQRMTDKCFRKCIGKPGGSLDNSEQEGSAPGEGHHAWQSTGSAKKRKTLKEVDRHSGCNNGLKHNNDCEEGAGPGSVSLRGTWGCYEPEPTGRHRTTTKYCTAGATV